MRRILLVGAFGQSNPGDEALLSAFVRHLPEWEPVAVSRDTAATRARHGCAAVDPGDLPGVAATLRACDGVVFAGGTIFKRLREDTGRHPLGLLSSAVGLAGVSRALGIPVALVGVGAGDLSGKVAPRLARQLVRLSQLLVLRDEESGVVLAEAGVPSPFRVGSDAAWTLFGDDHLPVPAPADDAPILVAVSRHADEPGLVRSLGYALSALVGAVPAPRIDIQPWQLDDLRLARELLQVLPPKSARIIAPPASLIEARNDAVRARAVIGLRFHALVAAAAAGTPFVAYTHEPKLAALARRFDQPALATTAQLTDLPAAIERARAAPPPHSVVRAEAARAEEAFRLLRLLLSGGDDDDLATLAGLTLVPGAWRP